MSVECKTFKKTLRKVFETKFSGRELSTIERSNAKKIFQN